MPSDSDRHLGMHRNITRRDFLHGVGGAVAGSFLIPGHLQGLPGLAGLQASTVRDGRLQDYYPPALTGLRGSHPGSFEVAHSLRDGTAFDTAVDTGERYDLVVVGAGLSGLASAYFFQTSAGSDARTLVLDNHDDFGGHAKRNEFTYEGRTLLVNGGTLNLEGVDKFSTVARTLLAAVGIDLQRAAQTDLGGSVYDSLGLGSATFFAREVFGDDRLVTGSASRGPDAERRAWLARTPLPQQARDDLARLYGEGVPSGHLSHLGDADRKEYLARISYRRFLEEAGSVHPQALAFLDDMPKGLLCVGIDAVPALYGWAQGYPGFQALNLEPMPRVGPLSHIGGGQHGRENEWGEGPDVHFPDGNATLARLLVNQLVPDALPATDMEDVVLARLDYGRLDRPGSAARIRLNSTVVRVEHDGSPGSAGEVVVTYVEGGTARKVRAEHVVLACWNTVIPYICPELSREQRDALAFGEKMPIVYTNVLLRNWRAFEELGVRNVSCPGMYHTGFGLARTIETGGYRPPRTPDEPIVVRMTRTPCAPGLPKKDQHRIGRMDLLATPFERFEREIRDQMARGLAGTGFDPARDIVGITVNRWPHGYAYSYNSLEDPLEWSFLAPDDRPCIIGSRRFGRISIANSDAAATPHTDAAIDEGYRAVGEQLVVRSRARRRSMDDGASTGRGGG